MVKDLPNLRACIDEAIRLWPSLPGGLPRGVPAGGMHVSGERFDEDATLSVSTETVWFTVTPLFSMACPKNKDRSDPRCNGSVVSWDIRRAAGLV